MSTTKSLSLDEQRARLERRANVIRSRLLRTIDALDNRRHQVQEIGHHAKRLATPVAATFAGIAVLAIGGALAIRALVERRRERHFSYRVHKALAPFRTEARPPLWKEALRRVTLTAVGIIASELAKRGALAVVNGRALPGPTNGRALPGAQPPMLTG
jgi:hypothetical protein